MIDDSDIFTPLELAFADLNQKFTSKFKCVNTDAEYELSPEGHALFKFTLKLLASEDIGTGNQSFYFYMPTTTEYKGKTIEKSKREQKCNILKCHCSESELGIVGFLEAPKLLFNEIVPAEKQGKIKFNVIPFEITLPIKKEIKKDEKLNITVELYVKNYAIKAPWYKNLFSNKKFFLWWYLTFKTRDIATKGHLIIEHPERGKLKIVDNSEEVEPAQHGNKLICCVVSPENQSHKLCVLCEYSYTPEWKIVVVSMIVYDFFMNLLVILNSWLLGSNYLKQLLLLLGFSAVFATFAIIYLKRRLM